MKDRASEVKGAWQSLCGTGVSPVRGGRGCSESGERARCPFHKGSPFHKAAVRALAIAAAVGCAFTASADLSASAYVQDGLIAQWDGIENVDAGTHDATATVWSNLVSGTSYNWSLVSGKYEWEENAVNAKSSLSTSGWLATMTGVKSIPHVTFETFVQPEAGLAKTTGSFFRQATRKGNVFLMPGNVSGYLTSGQKGANLGFVLGDRFSTTLVYNNDGSAMSAVYKDGVAQTLTTPTYGWAVKDQNMSIGGISATDTDYVFKGRIHTIRLYNRALTPREAAFNAAIDKIRFTGTVPEGWSEDAGVLKVKVSVSCNPELGKFSVNGGSAVSEYEVWHTLGESVTLVVEGIGYQGLEGWTGNLPADVDRSSREIVVKCDIPMTIGVNFRGVRHVATSGADTEENGTAAAPYRTIQYAVERSAKGEVVKVAGGVYEEAVVTAVEGLRVEGSYTADFTARDLRNGRTVIKAPTASADCYKTTGLTNVLSGIDFTGGTYGFRNGCTSGTRAAHKLYQCVFSNNTYGAWCGGYKPNFNCYSCLFYRNGYGTYITGDNGADVYLYHCSFVENVKDAIYREHPYGAVHHIRNCVFVGNGRAINLNSTSSNLCNLYRNIYWNNADNFRSARGWADQSSYNGNGMLVWRAAPIFMDPALGDDFVPQTGSYAAKAGDDLSASIAEDLYGNAWDGAFDLGCCKTAAVSPCRAQSEMYLSPDGDDSNDGADAEHPMKTPAKAFPHLADGATVHFANGTYVGMAAIQANNVKVVGESRDGVILKAHEGEIPANNFDFALGLFGQNPSVANLTFETSHSGLLACDQSYNYNVDVENCKFTGNRVGLMDGILQTRNSARRLKVSHGIFRNNAESGISIGNTIVADNCLFADNGYYGIDGNTWDTSYKPRLNHCTFINNGSYGFIERSSGDRPYSYFANCIFYGNGKTRSTAAIRGGDRMTFYSCCFYDNQALYISSKGNPVFNGNITDDPRLNLTDGLKGHLLEGSPCSQSGVNKNSDANFSVCAVTDDLDYIDRNQEKVDVGCYISPETMKELAGHGYHVLTVAGQPEGWGAPNVGYGDNLLKDGTLALSVAEGIETSPFDGVRNYPLGTGVRAAYKGFEYTLEGAAEPTFSSATDESIATFAFEQNAIWKIKWQRQYLVTVSTDAPGCLVRLDDGAPATTVQKWIPEGQSYTVAFVPTDDFQFDGWGAGFPPEGDARYVSTTVSACSGSATFSPVYKSIICVAKSGDDETGNGTAASPFLTIAKAMATAKSRDVIRIQTGLYEESVTNTALQELTIEGGYTANWTRDLRNAPTTIRPPSNKLPCVYINNVNSNVVKGLVLTGGSYGIVAYGQSGRRDSAGAGGHAGCAARNHRLVSLVITNNVSHGVEGAKVMINGVRVISSLIAFNGGNGANFGGDTTSPSYIQNCTVVSNKGYGVTFGTYNYTYFEVRNSIVACNGNVDLHNGHYEQTVGFNCLFREDDAKKTSACSGYFNIGGNLIRDPQLNADFSLKPTSPCVAAGYDFSTYTPYPELEDLYGQPWNGTYDIGAIKSDVTPQKSDDVYVEDGDDLQLAVARCNENGTVHVAAGEYAGPVSITTKGIKVIGAGPGKSIIRSIDTGADTDLPSTYAVQLAGTGAVLSGFTLTGAARGGGVLLGMSDYAKRCVVSDCTLTGNKWGVRYHANGRNVGWPLEPALASNKSAYHRLTRCRCVGNSSHGINITGYGYCGLIADNCLSAKNGGNGVYAHEGSGSGFWVYDDFYYCTFADNAGVGLQSPDGDTAEIRCYNSIVTGNAKGIKHGSYGQIEMKYSVLAGNEIEKEGGSYSFDHCQQEVAPTFETREGAHAYWPAVGSSAVGVPRALIPHDPLNPSAFEDPVDEPLTDLAGNPRKWKKQAKRVAGCFAFPRNGLMLFVR